MPESDSTARFGLTAHMLSGNLFPAGDAEDLAQGASHIPDKVTDARRAGQHVKYVRDHCPYWVLPDKTQIYERGPCAECAPTDTEPAS